MMKKFEIITLTKVSGESQIVGVTGSGEEIGVKRDGGRFATYHADRETKQDHIGLGYVPIDWQPKQGEKLKGIVEDGNEQRRPRMYLWTPLRCWEMLENSSRREGNVLPDIATDNSATLPVTPVAPKTPVQEPTIAVATSSSSDQESVPTNIVKMTPATAKSKKGKASGKKSKLAQQQAAA